jgi:hypothetical protein
LYFGCCHWSPLYFRNPLYMVAVVDLVVPFIVDSARVVLTCSGSNMLHRFASVFSF